MLNLYKILNIQLKVRKSYVTKACRLKYNDIFVHNIAAIKELDSIVENQKQKLMI
tara:strand:- start:4969 stop:5133 length:165 start_codon:yes stop_codon:yes gene_type:complete